MSSSTINLQNIHRLSKEVADLQSKLSDISKKESDVTTNINRANDAIHRTKSLSTISSKMNEIARLQRNLSELQKKKSDISKRIADKSRDLSSYERRQSDQEARDRKRIADEQKRLIDQRRFLERQVSSNVSLARYELPDPEINRSIPHKSDFFISHASEDKDGIVRELAEALRAKGADVWYDEFTLRVGDSLRTKIDEGLANCRFGIVVLSESFFKKPWTQQELNGLVNREIGGYTKILPIWHKISKDEVSAHSLHLPTKSP